MITMYFLHEISMLVIDENVFLKEINHLVEARIEDINRISLFVIARA